MKYIYIIFFLFSIKTMCQDWQLLGLSNEYISSLAIDPSDPSIIYAGSISDFSTGTRGSIFKSTDSGATWDTLVTGVTVIDLDINPLYPDIIFASLASNFLTRAGILKSIDKGKNWFSSDSGIYISSEEGLSILEFDKQHPDTLYCGTAGEFGGKLYKSTNGGNSWFRIDPDTPWVWTHRICGDSIFTDGYPLRSGISALEVDLNKNERVYTGTPGNGFLFKSDNGGKNWKAACLPVVWEVNDIKVNQLNSSEVYCGTLEGFFISYDSAYSWIKKDKGLPDNSVVKKIITDSGNGVTNIFAAVSAQYSSGLYKLIDNEYWEKIGDDILSINNLALTGRKIYAGSHGIFVRDIITSIRNNKQVDDQAVCSFNYPNPFNSQTTINLKVLSAGKFSVTIYDVLGNKVNTLFEGELNQGNHSFNWNSKTESGYSLSSGLYICNIQAANLLFNLKMILLK